MDSKIEQVMRESDLEALENYRRGLAPAPVLYKAEGGISAGQGKQMVFVASEESPDRLGDVISVSGWELDNFKRNNVFLYGHDSTQHPPIGTFPRIWAEGKQLLAAPKWDDEDPFAAAVKGKYERGVMKAVSVGFRALEFQEREIQRDRFGRPIGGDMGGLLFLKQELVEISAVAVPAHPDALLRMLEQRKAFSLAGEPGQRSRPSEADLTRLWNDTWSRREAPAMPSLGHLSPEDAEELGRRIERDGLFGQKARERKRKEEFEALYGPPGLG